MRRSHTRFPFAYHPAPTRRRSSRTPHVPPRPPFSRAHPPSTHPGARARPASKCDEMQGWIKRAAVDRITAIGPAKPDSRPGRNEKGPAQVRGPTTMFARSHFFTPRMLSTVSLTVLMAVSMMSTWMGFSGLLFITSSFPRMMPHAHHATSHTKVTPESQTDFSRYANTRRYRDSRIAIVHLVWLASAVRIAMPTSSGRAVFHLSLVNTSMKSALVRAL